MNKDIEILAKRKIGLEDVRISDEIQSEIRAAKIDITTRGLGMDSGAAVAKMHEISRRNLKERTEAVYKAYKEALSVAGIPMTEAVLRECAAQATPYYENAAKNIAGFIRNQCRGIDDIDRMLESLNVAVERDRDEFLNHVEIDCTEARLKTKVALPGELLKLRQLPNADNLQKDLSSLLNGEHPTGVLFIDLDGFKAVNDHQGHDLGDGCLEAAVRIIGNAIIGKGRLYRRGGDEFVAVLHNSTITESAVTAERIRSAVDAFQLGGSDKVTVSIGVASSEQANLDSAEAPLNAADQAMYGSKYTTKNRVLTWPLSRDVVEAVSEGRRKAGER